MTYSTLVVACKPLCTALGGFGYHVRLTIRLRLEAAASACNAAGNIEHSLSQISKRIYSAKAGKLEVLRDALANE